MTTRRRAPATTGRRTTGFRHVLVPLDLGRRHARALEAAAGVVDGAGGGQITLLHVVQRIEDVPFAEIRGFYEDLAARAERHLASAARRLAACGIDARTVVVIGDPAAEIVRQAERRRVDLIVLASHPVDTERRGWGWGTTSYKVGVLCACPVLLVK
jgi:nucleotide-binding universal stress UspA family protein